MVSRERFRLGHEVGARIGAALSAVALCVMIGPAQAEGPRAHEGLWKALEEMVTLSPAPGDLAVLSRVVGAEPKAIQAWVAANIRWEPYEGVLRGAAGAAAARAGNAVDQALLVQALLKRAGKTATLMTRGLSAVEGKALLERFLASDGKVVADVPRMGKEAVAKLGIEAGDVASAEALAKADGAAVDEAVAAATQVGAVLAAALEKSLRARRVAAPRVHVWVELDGVAIDPVAPELAREGGKVLDARGLERMRHTLVASLVMQRTRAGKAEEEVLVRVPVALDEVAFSPIELTIQPDAKALGMTPAEGRKDPKGLVAKLEAAGVLRASLLMGDRRHGAAAFDRKGVRYDIADDGEAQGPAGLGQSLGGALGGFGLGGGKPKVDGPLALVAVVFRVEVKGPGEGNNPERVHERVLVTPTAGELPMVRVSLLAENLLLAPGERERSTIRGLQRSRGAFEALVARRSDAAERVEAPREPVDMLMRYADLRREVEARLGAGVALRERAGLVAMIDRLVVDPKGALVVQRRFDIFANAIAFVGADGTIDVKAAIAQGVADTALEAALVGPATSEAARRGTAWAMLGAATGETTIERSGGLLKVGYAGSAAWWSVDPKSGATVGRVPGGGGQAMVEYAYNVSTKACNWAWVLGIYASAAPSNEAVQGANTWAGRICSVLSGTEAQQAEMEHIQEISNGLWKIAIPALLGLPAPKK